MLRKADNNYVQQWKIGKEEKEGLRGVFDSAVQAMQVRTWVLGCVGGNGLRQQEALAGGA